MPALSQRRRITLYGAGLLLAVTMAACNPFVARVPAIPSGGSNAAVPKKAGPTPKPSPTATATPDPVPGAALAFASTMIDGLISLKGSGTAATPTADATALGTLPFLPSLTC